MRSIRTCLLVLCAAATLPAAVRAAEEPEKLFPEDWRLDQRMTVRRGRVYLGELLEQLAADSRVRLTVEDTKGAVSGIDMTVFLHERPLREVMRGLTGLFSRRRDPWSWKASGGGYVLRHTMGPEALAAALREATFARWQEDARFFYRVARLPEAERAAAKASCPELFIAGNQELIAALTPQQLEGAIRGEFVPLDLTRLNPAARAKLYHYAIPPGAPPSDRPPGLYLSWRPTQPGPILMCRNEYGQAGSAMGNSLLHDVWLRQEYRDWTFFHDPAVEAIRHRQEAKDPAAGLPLGLPEPGPRGWLKRLSELQPFDALTDLAALGEFNPTVRGWRGNSLEQSQFAFAGTFWDIATRRVAPVARERELWLVRHKSAGLMPRRHLVPWSTIKTLRTAAERNDGETGLELAGLFAELSEEQLGGLSEEFPAAGNSEELVQTWRPILRFAARLKRESRLRLLTEEGIPIRECGLPARDALAAGPDLQNRRGLQLLVQEFPRAVVSLRTEVSKQQVREGERIVERERTYLLWEVRVPEIRPHQRRLALLGRQPLRPE